MNRMLLIWMIWTAAVLGVVILVQGIYYDHGSVYTRPLFFALVLVALSQVYCFASKVSRPPDSGPSPFA
jgi:hypothetical protein